MFIMEGAILSHFFRNILFARGIPSSELTTGGKVLTDHSTISGYSSLDTSFRVRHVFILVLLAVH